MQVKALLDEWERRSPGRRQKMFRALTTARPSHLLDPELFDFAGLMRRPGKAADDTDTPDRPHIPTLR
jgi:tRNA 2-thiocytidine biosynthesis protein TtcA